LALVNEVGVHILLSYSNQRPLNIWLNTALSESEQSYFYLCALIPWTPKGGQSARRTSMLLLIIVLVLLFGGGGGYYGYSRWGSRGGMGIVGTVLLIVLLVYLLGGLRL
jgi:hypothetical protein